MDTLLQEILRELTAMDPAAAARLREIMGSNLSPLVLLRALYQLLMENLIDRALLTRLLNMYVRAGLLDAAIVDLAVAEAEADLAKAAADAAARAAKRARMLRWGARGTGLAILICLLAAAIADSRVNLEHEPSGQGACAVEVTPVPVEANESSYGPKSAMRDAMEEIKRKCNNKNFSCNDPSCQTCSKDPFVTFTDIKVRIFWYTAVVKADCRCWCK